jgi:predicted DsbA family dithiol-disulfide isomerase
MAPRVTVWNDYICPWAYAARPRTDWLRGRGVDVDMRFYELHPTIGPEGRATRPGGRLDGVFDHIADECATAGLDFIKPTRTPNSRRCLEVMELLRAHYDTHLTAVDAAMARAHWVEGRPLDDRSVVHTIVAANAGDDVANDVADRLDDGEGSALLAASRDEAHDVGVTATPGWRIGELTITGLHPPEQFERWAGRVLGLADSRSSGRDDRSSG